jgi:hypothetical protein
MRLVGFRSIGRDDAASVRWLFAAMGALLIPGAGRAATPLPSHTSDASGASPGSSHALPGEELLPAASRDVAFAPSAEEVLLIGLTVLLVGMSIRILRRVVQRRVGARGWRSALGRPSKSSAKSLFGNSE